MGCVSLEQREHGDLWKALSAVSPPPPQVSLLKNTVFLPENWVFPLVVHLSFTSLIVISVAVEVIPI